MTLFEYLIIAVIIGLVLVLIGLRLTRKKIEQSAVTSPATFKQQLKSGHYTLVQFYADF